MTGSRLEFRCHNHRVLDAGLPFPMKTAKFKLAQDKYMPAGKHRNVGSPCIELPSPILSIAALRGFAYALGRDIRFLDSSMGA